ncbi:hypothetical protein PV08_02326 [Exophiala spinifera]|uniref:Zn(2)-C6 fungal-type domain-containing protein n=1 Tax=Exophiala spinifera TaxID=91928 RepID=A0A0D2C378_9EURO|nr:uncharacterized protein PV08_02326 [Exophiala spinifera]KIW18039.1 hypothetical protein PV08_02326 [Exophiala spinifera]
MVGVPGKSKGCSTCRRRKKGCDQKRPICGQCASSGNVCGGYKRDRTFILHPASKAVEKAIFLPYTRTIVAPLPGSLNQTAVQAQCRSLFWDLYMPQGDCACRDAFLIRCGHPMNWAELIQDVPRQDNALEEAFSALTISRVGQANKDVRLVRESSRIYGRALKELQEALFDPKRMYSDHTLMACMLLGLYEVFEGPAFRSRSWLTHAAGAARLVQLRGPERHQHWEAHHPFLASRIPTVYASILQRKSTYLATEEWLTIPWVKMGHRTYFDRLTDTTTLIPGFLEKLDILRESDSDIGQDLIQLLDDCKTVQVTLDKWRDGTKKGATPRVQRHDPNDTDGYPFETDLWFENHLFVHARVVYYACSLTLAELGDDIMQALELREHKLPESMNPTLLKDILNAERYASNICRTVPYCLQPDMGAWGANIINFPANLAYFYYQRIRRSDATRWLENAFERVKQRGVHAEHVFNELLFRLREKEEPNFHLKRESSTETTESGGTPGSVPSLSTTATTFIYEDPSKAYYNASNDPD